MYKHMNRDILTIIIFSAMITFMLIVGYGIQEIGLVIITFLIVICLLLMM